MVHAEVVGVKNQQPRRCGIAQLLLNSCFLTCLFLDSLREALRQADKEEEEGEEKTHSMVHDRDSHSVTILTNFSRISRISQKLGKNRFNTDFFIEQNIPSV
jgi:hypothetical protein